MSSSNGPGILPLWSGAGRMKLPFTSTSIRLTPLKLVLLLFASTFLAQLLPSLPAWIVSPSSPAPASPPFYIPPRLFDPLPSHLALSRPKTYASGKSIPTDRIPNIVHFVYGYKDPGEGDIEGELMPYYAYLAVRSALVNIKPEEVIFHHLHEPRGPFWDLLKPHLTLVKTPAPTEIYGRKLNHFAHKSDVIRLQALSERGGIYLDIDMFVIRPFTPLMDFEVVMAMEASPNSQKTALQPEGLCNAVILARPDSRFLDRWLASYQTFDGGTWAGHSVQKPWELARQHPSEITVLSNRAFFWPLWEGSGEESRIRYVHEESKHDFHASGQFAYHTWESLAAHYLEALTPQSLEASQSSFGKMAKRFITPDDDEAYRVWKETKDRETKRRDEIRAKKSS
ncbi:hypothetical protein BDY24DRAFT_386906 [Mrakia frigida]|uniref:uncharacterized protein n=1 Tax=Mrakia frigida TaxID=29902 RepID=UPI003FCC25A8